MMLKLPGRKVDEWGNVIFETDGLVEHLLRGLEITPDMKAADLPGIQKFNQLCKELDHPEDQIKSYIPPEDDILDWDEAHHENWFIPDEYHELDVKNFLLLKCHTTDEIQRVLDEWQIYEDRGMIDVLKCLIYLVDHFRKNKIVWGVGRGSSVASYILFLIGIHKVNSIKFNLDIKEFLK